MSKNIMKKKSTFTFGYTDKDLVHFGSDLSPGDYFYSIDEIPTSETFRDMRLYLAIGAQTALPSKPHDTLTIIVGEEDTNSEAMCGEIASICVDVLTGDVSYIGSEDRCRIASRNEIVNYLTSPSLIFTG